MNKNIYLLFLAFFLTTALRAQKIIIVDFESESGIIKDLNGVNRGPSDRAEGYKDAGITKIRTHDYHDAFDYAMYSDFWNFDSLQMEFTTINEDFNPENPEHYHWFSTDSVFNEYDVIDAEAYFRLGISYPNPNMVIQPNHPPLDPDGVGFSKFAELCKRTVMHCNGDWNNGLNRNIRYWEIWNEPKGEFWNGTPLQFYKMYDEVRDSIKAFDAELKVGALGALPITTLGLDTTYSSAFFSWLNNNNSGLDFYSWHIYGIQNPYALMEISTTIRDNLDDHGFANAESHISEINNKLEPWLPQFTDSPEGAAYYSSNLITAQLAPVDKLFWYSGAGFFYPDTSGMPNYTWSAYAFKIFDYMAHEASLQLATLGQEAVNGYMDVDTTNLMILSGKSPTEDKVYVMVSNYNSSHENFDILIENLPWNSSDEIKLTKNIIKGPNDKFTETVDFLQGAPLMPIDISDMPAPSVIFLRLEKYIPISIEEASGKNVSIYPNPASHGKIFVAVSEATTAENVTLTSLNGQEIMQLGKMEIGPHQPVSIDVSNLDNGIYFLNLKTKNGTSVRKFIVND